MLRGDMIDSFISLSTKNNFNSALGHFRVVTEIVTLMKKHNLADIVEEMESQGHISKAQILPILNAVVIEKFGYKFISFNLVRHVRDFNEIYNILKEWNKFDIVVAYHHPQLGISLINPPNLNHWKIVGDFTAEDMIVVYAKERKEEDHELLPKALLDMKRLFDFGTVDNFETYHVDEPLTEEKPEVISEEKLAVTTKKEVVKSVKKEEGKAADASSLSSQDRRTMTPKYSVQVTNELFHNGNVEAWKNIIESYKKKFPDSDVYIFHDGQRINNINALFKWGKVKHGDVILFSIAAKEIKGIAKLQRYLFEGASNRFLLFMKKDINKSLNLF